VQGFMRSMLVLRSLPFCKAVIITVTIPLREKRKGVRADQYGSSSD
jgi:hypothetical protein